MQFWTQTKCDEPWNIGNIVNLLPQDPMYVNRLLQKIYIFSNIFQSVQTYFPQIRTIDPVVERDYSVVYFCAK